MIIRDPKQIGVMSSPVRLAIIDILENAGPCSVAAVASAIGMRPDGLYYHLRILEQHGLVKSSEKLGRRGPEAVIDLAVRPMTMHYDASRKSNRDAINRLAGAMLRAAARAFRAAFRKGVRVSGLRRELWAVQQTARLTDAELIKVNRLLRDLIDVFGSARKTKEGGKLYTVTFVLTP